MRLVFDLDVEARDALCGSAPATPFACFDADGACIASLEILKLSLVLDGARREAAGLRSVAVHPAWRGRGLFRALMDAALAWFDAAMTGPMLLYTEDPALYARFGFREQPQHRFSGLPPASTGTPGTRRLSLGMPDDLALIRRLLATRAPPSNQVAICDSGTLFLAQVLASRTFCTQAPADDAFTLDFLDGFDALIVSDPGDAGLFTLVDVVALAIPPLGAILAARGEAVETVSVLFPPDKLRWTGEPESDDAGLMIRGHAGKALSRPFRIPPTAEF